MPTFDNPKELGMGIENAQIMRSMLDDLRKSCKEEGLAPEDVIELTAYAEMATTGITGIKKWFSDRQTSILLARGGKKIPTRFIGYKLQLVVDNTKKK